MGSTILKQPTEIREEEDDQEEEREEKRIDRLLFNFIASIKWKIMNSKPY